MRQRVCAALENDGVWLVEVHDAFHHRFEELSVGVVFDPLPQGHIHRVPQPLPGPFTINMPRIRKEPISVLVKTQRHNPIRVIEGLLDPVPVMHINIHIQHPRIIPISITTEILTSKAHKSRSQYHSHSKIPTAALSSHGGTHRPS